MHTYSTITTSLHPNNNTSPTPRDDKTDSERPNKKPRLNQKKLILNQEDNRLPKVAKTAAEPLSTTLILEMRRRHYPTNEAFLNMITDLGSSANAVKNPGDDYYELEVAKLNDLLDRYNKDTQSHIQQKSLIKRLYRLGFKKIYSESLKQYSYVLQVDFKTKLLTALEDSEVLPFQWSADKTTMTIDLNLFEQRYDGLKRVFNGTLQAFEIAMEQHEDFEKIPTADTRTLRYRIKTSQSYPNTPIRDFTEEEESHIQFLETMV